MAGLFFLLPVGGVALADALQSTIQIPLAVVLWMSVGIWGRAGVNTRNQAPLSIAFALRLGFREV